MGAWEPTGRHTGGAESLEVSKWPAGITLEMVGMGREKRPVGWGQQRRLVRSELVYRKERPTFSSHFI